MLTNSDIATEICHDVLVSGLKTPCVKASLSCCGGFFFFSSLHLGGMERGAACQVNPCGRKSVTPGLISGIKVL